MNNQLHNLLEYAQICEGFIPVDLQTGTNSGDWVSMRDYSKLLIMFYKAVGTGGDDPVITVLQGLDNAGGSSKALNFTKVYSKTGTTNLQSTPQYTKTTQAAANTYTATGFAAKAGLFLIDIDARDLDADNLFYWVQASVGDVGSNAQLGCMLYMLYDSRYPMAPEKTFGALTT